MCSTFVTASLADGQVADPRGHVVSWRTAGAGQKVRRREDTAFEKGVILLPEASGAQNEKPSALVYPPQVFSFVSINFSSNL